VFAHTRGGESPVAVVMIHHGETVGPNDNVQEIVRLMKRARRRRVPDVDSDDCLIGIVAQADLAVVYARLDLDRELEVQEVTERTSEPMRLQRRVPPTDPET
jgi:CBS domain-containing protein